MKFLNDFQKLISGIFKKVPLPQGIMWALTLLIIYLVYRILTKLIEGALLKSLHGDTHKLKIPLKIWRIFFWVIAIILFLAGTGGNLATLGLSAALIGMVLGWSLQRPVTGIAAWFLVTIMKPFKIGDRVIIAGIIGDVKNVGLMYVTMEQVGGTIGGESRLHSDLNLQCGIRKCSATS